MGTQAEQWRRISSKTIAESPVFTVKENQFVRNGDNKPVPFYSVDVPDWVNIIALTENDELVLIEQFRQGIEAMVLELPSGIVDEGEGPEAAARRELLEETGYEANEWILLAKSQPNPAFHNNFIHHYLARGARWVREPELDENESVTTMLKSLNDSIRLVDDGTMAQSMVVAAFYYFERFKRGNENSIA